jgi:hypothetical protein
LDVETGQVRQRWRGFADANLVACPTWIWALHGDGKLSRLDLHAEAVTQATTFACRDMRSWTAPAWDGDGLLIRNDEELLCLTLTPTESGESPSRLQVLRKRSLKTPEPVGKQVALEQAPPDLDPLAPILAAYSDSGAESAWKIYEQLERARPDALSTSDRLRLAEMAEAEGLSDAAVSVIRRALQRDPDSRELNEALRRMTSDRP